MNDDEYQKIRKKTYFVHKGKWNLKKNFLQNLMMLFRILRID
jgi:hypothetical protein